MKKIYLLVPAMLVAVTGMSQLVNTTQKTALTEQNPALADPSQINTTQHPDANASDRAAGDVIWETDFGYSANWDITMTGGTANPTHNWVIGSSTTWSLPAMSSTSGAPYATCQNGNPSGGTQYAGGTYTLAMDSVFDLSSYAKVLLEFEQFGAKFNDLQTCEVSTNGGTVWTTVNSNANRPGLFLGAGDFYANTEFVQFDITSAIAGNPANVRIRFVLTWPSSVTSPGITYGWMIDDVKLREGYQYDVELVNPFLSVGQWPADISKIPGSQATDVTFSATVVNRGTSALTGLSTTANVPSASFSGSSTGSALAIGAADSLVVTTVLTTPATNGNHPITFGLTANETLANTYNDGATESIQVTTNIMAVDRYDGTEESITSTFFGWSAPTGSTATIGNVFEVYADGVIGGVQVGIRDYSTTESAEGNILVIQLWKFDGTDFVFEYAYEDYIVEGGDVGDIAEVIFPDQQQVTAGDIYYIGAGYYIGSEVYVMMAGTSPIGTVFGTDDVLVTLVDSDPTVTVVGSPVVRAIFKDYTAIEEQTATNFTIGQNVPNPFDNTSVITYTLNEASNVSVQITDVTGKVVQTITPGTQVAGTYTLTIDAANLADGMYFYTFTVGNEIVTKQMVVSKK